MSIGILITNLGTPSAPTPNAVREYLAEFLWDPYVVKIPRLLWWFILKGIVLQVRPKKSAQLYQKIWTTTGSPLLSFSVRLIEKLESTLQDLPIRAIELGMRYGEPSLKNALQKLHQKNVSEIIVLPLYPQFSNTTTESTRVKINAELKALHWTPKVHFIKSYHDNDHYIAALAQQIKNHQQNKEHDKLVFSFHGLPQKSITEGDPYYEQCTITASKIAQKLQLEKADWAIAFQSRFGRQKWLQPYCTDLLQTLAKTGHKNITVVCPGFSIDCLETLEEMAMTNKEIFMQAGGQKFHYIPALNDGDLHVALISSMLIPFFNSSSYR